jgi:hypothetical protein
MKIPPVGAEFFHADRRTDRRNEASSRFSQSCETAYKLRMFCMFQMYDSANQPSPICCT